MEVAAAIPVPTSIEEIGTLRVAVDGEQLQGLTASAGVIADFEHDYLGDLTVAVTRSLRSVQRLVIKRLRARATATEFAKARGEFANPWRDGDEGLVAAGPFDLNDFNVMTAEEWAEAFDVEAADIVGDVVVDAATGQPLRAGLNVNDQIITDLIDRHVARLQGLGPLVQTSIRDTLRLAVTNQLSLEEVIREIRSTGPLAETSARAIARTELTAATNGGMLTGWRRDGFPFKKWVALHDERVRHAHLEADGQVVPTEQEFEVGGRRAQYPGDPRLPIELRINCRCYMDRVGQSGQTIDTRLVDLSRGQLYRLAQELNIPGRSKMRKPDLFQAIDRYRSGFGYQSLEEMTLAQLLIRAKTAGIVGRWRMRKPELMVRLRDRSRGRSRERWLIDAGHGTQENLEAAQAQLRDDLAAITRPPRTQTRVIPGRSGMAVTVSAEQTAQIRTDVFRRYGGAETGTIVCVGCGARLHWSNTTRWEQMTLVRIDPNRPWSALNAMPVCLADASRLVKRRWSFANLDLNHWSMWQTFANPWHDELGRFAPKGYVRNGASFSRSVANPPTKQHAEAREALIQHRVLSRSGAIQSGGRDTATRLREKITALREVDPLAAEKVTAAATAIDSGDGDAVHKAMPDAMAVLAPMFEEKWTIREPRQLEITQTDTNPFGVPIWEYNGPEGRVGLVAEGVTREQAHEVIEAVVAARSCMSANIAATDWPKHQIVMLQSKPEDGGLAANPNVIAWVNTKYPSYINLAEDYFDRPPHPTRGVLVAERQMASAAVLSEQAWNAAHETGHATVYHEINNATFEQMRSMRVNTMQNMYDKWWHSSLVSDYGRTNPQELHAETFAEWVWSGGTTNNPVVRDYASAMDWDVPYASIDKERPLAASGPPEQEVELVPGATDLLRPQTIVEADTGPYIIYDDMPLVATGIEFGNPWHDQIGRFAPKGTGRKVTTQGEWTPEHEAAAQTALDTVLDHFPNAPEVTMKRSPDITAMANKSKDSIYLNDGLWFDDQRFDQWSKELAPYTIRSDRAGVIVHEYAHVLDTLLADHDEAAAKELFAYVTEPISYEVSGKSVTVPRWQLGHNGDRVNPVKAPSVYGTESKYEWIAEAVSDVIYNGDNANPQSRPVYDIMKRVYG